MISFYHLIDKCRWERRGGGTGPAAPVLAGPVSRKCDDPLPGPRFPCFNCFNLPVFVVSCGYMASCSFSLPDIPAQPHQPQNFKFPRRKFGQKKIVERSCRSDWFKSWPWLHYHEELDVVFCHTCVKALKEKKIRQQNCDASFVSYNSAFTVLTNFSIII